MSEESQGRPGKNGGGRLKTGNTKNVGRKPNEIRARLMQSFDNSIGDIQKIASGKLVIIAHDQFGKPYKRKPTVKERLDAIDILAKYGLGTKMDVTSDDLPIKAYVNVDDSLM